MNEQEKWKSSLLEGEKLKWTGRPEDVKLMDTSSRGMTILCKYRDRVTSMLITPDMAVSVRKRQGGKGHLLAGETADKADSKLRGLSGKTIEKNGKITGMVLYHIAAPEQTAACITGKSR